MPAYQFDVIHSASRLVRGRLLLEFAGAPEGARAVQWAYVEPAESTNVRAHGTGGRGQSGKGLTLIPQNRFGGGASVWGMLGEFEESKAKAGAMFTLTIQDSGFHAAALTAVHASGEGGLMSLLKEGAVRPRTETQIRMVLQRTVVTPVATVCTAGR